MRIAVGQGAVGQPRDAPQAGMVLQKAERRKFGRSCDSFRNQLAVDELENRFVVALRRTVGFFAARQVAAYESDDDQPRIKRNRLRSDRQPNLVEPKSWDAHVVRASAWNSSLSE